MDPLQLLQNYQDTWLICENYQLSVQITVYGTDTLCWCRWSTVTVQILCVGAGGVQYRYSVLVQVEYSTDTLCWCRWSTVQILCVGAAGCQGLLT